MIGTVADTRPGAFRVIEGKAVRIRTPVFEFGRIVDLPVLSQTGVSRVVHPSAAVLRGAEGRTGGLAANGVPTRALQCQLVWTVGVDVRVTGGGSAVVVLV